MTHIAVDHPTLGISLSAGEFSTSGTDPAESPDVAKRRQHAAIEIVSKLDPDSSVHINADTLRPPTADDITKAMNDLFLSPSLFAVVNAVIGYAGKTDMTIALRQVMREGILGVPINLSLLLLSW